MLWKIPHLRKKRQDIIKSRETIKDGNPNSREYNRCVRFLITQENIITKICGVLNDIEMQSNSCCICIM